MAQDGHDTVNESEKLHFQEALQKKDFERAAEILRPAADSGDTEAQYELGVMYRRGEGLAANSKQAAHWWGKAANRGHARSEYNLGTLYMLGEGVPRSTPEALAWTEKAARHGFPDAAYKLGWMLRQGFGGDERRQEGLHWLRRAAQAGHGEANYLLAVMEFLRSLSENSSDRLAEMCRLLGKAALQRHPAAWFVLGEIHDSKVGIGKNSVAQCFLLGSAVYLLRPDLHAVWLERLEQLSRSDAQRIIEALMLLFGACQRV